MSATLLFFCLTLSGINPRAVGPSPSAPPASRQSDVRYLTALLKQVESVKDPTLRIFLRIKIATYLGSNLCDSISAESELRIASEDLIANKKDIPGQYVDLFRKSLLVDLKAPAAKQELFLAEEEQQNRTSDLQLSYSLLTKKGDVPGALEHARRHISNSKSLDPYIVFVLRELDKRSPADVPGLLGIIMSAEESRPGFLSGSSFFMLKHLFVREQTPRPLQRRYLVALINSAAANDLSAAAIVDTYRTLSAVLPEVGKLSPGLYEPAVDRLGRLAVRLPDEERERLAADQRVNESEDPIAQLLVEAGAAKSPTLKDELLTKAAQLSLERGNVRGAIEIVLRLRINNADAALWRDQFIERAVESALMKGNVEAARYGSAHIRSVAVRSSALQKIALYLQNVGEVADARETLNFAFGLIDFSDDDANKAAALLDMTGSFMKVDKDRLGDLIRTTVKTINRAYPATQSMDTGGEGRLRRAEDLMKVAYRIGPAFKALADVSPSAAAKLARNIQSQELGIAAALSAYIGRPAGNKCR